MVTPKYIDCKTFQDFKKNQDELIKILNHNVTMLTESNVQLSTDVSWLKKLIAVQTTLIGGILVAIISKILI
jgi:hypothetical protein